MNAITYANVRESLSETIKPETIKKVCDDHTPIIVTCEDERAVVIISLEDYQSMEETAYLLRSPENARRLSESVAELESGRIFTRRT